MLKEDVLSAKRFFTSGVGLLTTASGTQRDVMACEWTFNVSYEPFLIAVFVNPVHYTFDLLKRSNEFGINVASIGQAPLVHFVGSTTGKEIDKFKQFKIPTLKPKFIKPPLITGSVLSAECKVVYSKKIGDHVLFVGKVLRCLVDDEKQPLLYRGGKFHHIGKKLQRKR